MKRELQTKENEPICWQGDIFNSAVSAGFADICLLQKRDGKSEREAMLAFRFCLLGMKEIRATDSATWKRGIKSPLFLSQKLRFCIAQEDGGRLLCCPSQAWDGAREGDIGCSADALLQHPGSGSGRPTGGTAQAGNHPPMRLPDPGSRCGDVAAAPTSRYTNCAAHTGTPWGSNSPLPYSQLIPLNVAWGSQVADPGCVGCVYTYIYCTSIYLSNSSARECCRCKNLFSWAAKWL